MTLSLPERARRFHAVLYKLVGGSTEKQAKLKDVAAEIDRLGVMEMSEADFNAWAAKMHGEILARREADARKGP